MYLGLCLDSALSVKPAVREIQARASKSHAPVAAVSYSIQHDKRRWNPSAGCGAVGCSPSKIRSNYGMPLCCQIIFLPSQPPPTSLDHRVRASTQCIDPDRLPLGSVMPLNVCNALAASCEKCYKRHLEARTTKLWLVLL